MPRSIILQCLNPLSEPPRAERILVIRLGALGDVVRTLPILADLRAAYPLARISWLVERRAADLLHGQPGLDEVIVFPREVLRDALRSGHWKRFVRESNAFRKHLVEHDFDWVLDFHTIFKSGLLSWLTGAPNRVAYAPPFGREWSWLFANHRARMERRRVSRHERNAGLIRYLGLESDFGRFQFRFDEERSNRRRERSEGRASLVLLHPGSSGFASYKRYGTHRLGEVARSISLRGDGMCWVLSGPDEDAARLAREVVESSQGHARSAPETPDLASLAALLEGADLYIGSDSGPLHLAAALGTPVVQIFGPTDPVENQALPGTATEAVRVAVACSPCRRGCRDATCMKVIPAERVAEAAHRLLARARGVALDVESPQREASTTEPVRSSLAAAGSSVFGSR